MNGTTGQGSPATSPAEQIRSPAGDPGLREIAALLAELVEKLDAQAELRYLEIVTREESPEIRRQVHRFTV